VVAAPVCGRLVSLGWMVLAQALLGRSGVRFAKVPLVFPASPVSRGGIGTGAA